jgi:hypothetical protein
MAPEGSAGNLRPISLLSSSSSSLLLLLLLLLLLAVVVVLLLLLLILLLLLLPIAPAVLQLDFVREASLGLLGANAHRDAGRPIAGPAFPWGPGGRSAAPFPWCRL